MSQSYKVKLKHDLVYGIKNKGQLIPQRRAGFALTEEGTDSIAVYRWDPGRYDFAVLSRAGKNRYTIFARKIYVDGVPRFHNPVGTAWVADDLSDHLTVQFYSMENVRLYVPLVSKANIAEGEAA